MHYDNYMMIQLGEFKIDAVLEKIHHPLTAGGHGFNELVFSITNVGNEINASEVSMAIIFPGQPDKHPLPFPEGVSTLKRNQSVAFNSSPNLTGISPRSIIVLTRIATGVEIARTKVRET